MRKLLVPMLGAALAVLFCIVLADAQPAPGFVKTSPLIGTGSSGSPLRIGPATPCASGEILKWNGSAWACAADGGGGGVSDGDKGDITVSGGGATWVIDPNVVDFTKQADIATSRIVGRVTAGTGDPEALTGTQATTLLDVFTSAAKGLAPASGGGTTNYLRADGTWAAPPGTNTGSGTANLVAKWTAANVLGNSSITDNGSGVTTTLPFGAPSVVDNGNRVFSIAGAGLTSSTATVDVVCTTNSLTCNANSIEIASRDFGDLTVGATGTTMTVDPLAITYAKIQNVSATSRIMGRITAGAGSMEELTGTQATSLLDTFSTSTTTKGLVPGSNSGGASVFLNGSGTWTAPTGDTSQTIAGGTLTALGVNSTTTLLYWAPGATSVLRGIANGAAGRRFKMVVNDTSIFNLAIEDLTATAANRIMQGDALAWDFKGPVVIEFAYDTTNSRWTFGPVTQYMPKLAVATSATVGTTLGVTGATTLSSTLVVTGAASLSSTLGVTGDTTHQANSYLGSTSSHVTRVTGRLEDSGGTLPTISACNSGTRAGGQWAFNVTPGSGTSCTATFATACTQTPTCSLTPYFSTTAIHYISAISTSAITFNVTGTGWNGSQVVGVTCICH